MKIFYRIQEEGIDFESMKIFNSDDGGDGLGNIGGLCACESITDLINVKHCTNGNELVVFYGQKLVDIYDGCRVKPIKEIARFDITELTQEQLYEIESIE